jgi:serine/threonine protein kinase
MDAEVVEILSGHLQKQGRSGAWRKTRCAITACQGVAMFGIYGRGRLVKTFYEITATLPIFLESDIMRIGAPGHVLMLRSQHPRKLQRYYETIQKLRTMVQYTMASFVILVVLGKGYYGKVMLCRKKLTGETYAIKTVQKSRLIEANKLHTIFTERNALVSAHHPFIVQMHFAFQTDTKFYLGLELVSGGELFRHMCNVGTVPISEVQLYVAEISLALDYLHSINIIYRDLKPENIMLDNEGHVKITDFGLAKQVTTKAPRTSTFCGTPEYLAPEIVGEVPYTAAVDWWAVGILTYELLFGATPFHRKHRARMYKEIETREVTFPDGADPTAVDFISRLLKKNPDERLDFQGIRAHPFMARLDFRDVLAKKYKPEFVPKVPRKLTDMTNFDSAMRQMPAADSWAAPVGKLFTGFSFMSPIAEEDQFEEDAPGDGATHDDGTEASAMPTDLFGWSFRTNKNQILTLYDRWPFTAGIMKKSMKAPTILRYRAVRKHPQTE